jgi:hypothetical protein
MNITIEQFLSGYENIAVALPQLLDDWPTIDEDLRDEYIDQLEWMLAHASELLTRAMEQGCHLAASERIATTNIKLRALKDRVRDVMGVELAV